LLQTVKTPANGHTATTACILGLRSDSFTKKLIQAGLVAYLPKASENAIPSYKIVANYDPRD